MAVRIVGVDLPQNKRGEIALTYIFGIGRSASKTILEKAGIDKNIKVKDWTDEEEISAYLQDLLDKKAFDQKGLIYGIGHAIYSISDPRAEIFKGFVKQLAIEKGREEEYALYEKVERLAPELIAKKRKMYKGVNANVDFYSGFVYEMLDIPQELYTPLFAIARIVGWSSHRIEEMIGMNKIIRPAYKNVGKKQDYFDISGR